MAVAVLALQSCEGRQFFLECGIMVDFAQLRSSFVDLLSSAKFFS